MTRRLAALATALAGVVTLASSLSANEPGRQALLEAVEPGSAQAAAHALGAIGGLLVLWLATGVLRGRRSAARAAVVVLGVLAVVHVAKGLDYEEAAIALVLALALHRGIEQAERRPSRSAVALLALLVGITGAYAFTLSILLASGHSAGVGQTLWTAARALAGGAPAAVGGEPRTLLHIAGAVLVGAIVVVLRALLAPAHARDGHDEAEHDHAATIVAEHGRDSIAPFALRADKAYFFSHGGVLAYRTLRETAVVAGDPVGPPGSAGEILADFEAFARGRGWDVVVLGAREEHLAGYAALGLRTMQVGLEAVVDPRCFDLDVPASKTVRKAVRRVARRGWTVELVRGAQLTPAVISDLDAVETAWRRGGHTRLYGFAMASDRLWGAPEDCHDLYAIARNPEGEARAFQRYVPYRGGLSLDAMRRLDDDPNGISDALVAAALLHARELGIGEVSLNFAGFGHLMAAESLERRSHRVASWALRRLHGRFQLERLARFANKFGPTWRPRFLVYTARTRLPLAALRVMQAEAYIRPPAVRAPQGSWRPAPRPITGASTAPSAISPAASHVTAR
jgi:lysyl-tRNA synthetase class 2